MTPQTTRPEFNPERIRPWQGPIPDSGQLMLLEACLAPRDLAGQAWRRWLATADFDHENPVTHELAAYAVLRLGSEAGDGAEARRCLGLFRRAWFLSQLGQEAALRVARASGEAAWRLMVLGDLAMALTGPSFAGRIFPVRSLGFGTSPWWGRRNRAAITAAAGGAGGRALRTGRLGIVCHPAPRVLWSASEPAPGPYASLRVPPLPLLVAELVRRNWCRHPSGGLRWVLELVTVMDQSADPDALAEAIVRASARLGSLRTLATVLDVLSPLSAGSPLEPLQVCLGNRGASSSCMRLRALIDTPFLPRRSRHRP